MKLKIVIAGIGGVGGYFGGLLAHHFNGNINIEIFFLARGEHLKVIQNEGLQIIKGENKIVAHPTLATDKAIEIGVADFIIVACKSYDLEVIIEQLKPCLNQDTLILPLQNGVDSTERIKKILPKNIVLEGCTYLVSRLITPGVIENSGNIQSIYFGLENHNNSRLLELEYLFKESHIDAVLSDTISKVIWEKFIFISSIATATSYFDKSIGEILSDNEKLKFLEGLIEEVKKVAITNGIFISSDISEKTFVKLRSLPFETTTSMHFDFQNKNPKNELETLTGYVVNEGKRYNLDLTNYKSAYLALKKT